MNKKITLAHGAGGELTSELINSLFKKYFTDPLLTADDAAVLPALKGRLAMSTDGFIVSPPFFPGGNIGKLSICGTVNDLACMGAVPKYITCACVIEEGFSIDDLEKITAAIAQTAEEAKVTVVAGDTKVAGKGQADGIFITTTGVGEIPEGIETGGRLAEPGDAVIVTGDIGRHGCAILLARDEFGINADITSDCAPLCALVQNALEASKNVHVIRDATRGGVGTVLYEIAAQSITGMYIEREALPVLPEVKGVCSMLGLDPLYLACEGRMVFIVPESSADAVLGAVKKCKYGEGAARIGTVTAENAGRVVVKTEIGTQTLLPKPQGELLPRIC